jgi:hypothetical protein
LGTLLRHVRIKQYSPKEMEMLLHIYIFESGVYLPARAGTGIQ